MVRTFGKKRKVQGEVVGWLPAAGDDEALWKVSDDMHHAWMSKKIYPYPHPIHTLLLSYPTLIPPFPNNRPTLTFTLSITLTPTLTSPIIQIRHTDGDEEDLDEDELLASLALAVAAEQERLERLSSGKPLASFSHSLIYLLPS